MVILHVLAPADVGGLERVVLNLVVGHRERGHEVRTAAVIDQGRDDHPFVAAMRRSGFDLHVMYLPPRRYLRERQRVAELCRQARPDVVHTHGYRCDVVSASAARALGIPTVTTVHGFTGGGPKNRLYERLQLWAFRRFDAVVAVSRPQVDRLCRAGVSRDRIHVIVNAWAGGDDSLDRSEARRRLGLPPAGFRVGWVGRLSGEKGLDVLLDAVSQLTDLPVSVSVVGEGRERAVLEARVAQLGLSERVDWHGAVPNAGHLLRAFDCFALSSRTEGTPMVLFEAMAAGTPIVATRVGGVPDVVTDEEALLVPPEDPVALARAIRAVHDDREAALVRVDAARRRLREFDLASWLTRYEAIYRQVQGLQDSVGDGR